MSLLSRLKSSFYARLTSVYIESEYSYAILCMIQIS